MKIVLTVLAVLLVIKLVRRVRGGRSMGCAHRRRSRASHRGSRWAGHIEDRLDLSSEQSSLVREQVKLFKARARSLEVPTMTRNRLAAVMRSESFDENILGEMFVEHDDALRTLRLEAVERLAAVHEALDPAQRESLASLLETGRGRWGGPFRS